MFLINRQLYNLCQMFPESASYSMKFVLRDAMHEMEGMVETTGRAAFPGLDVVSGGVFHPVAGLQPPAVRCRCHRAGLVSLIGVCRGAPRPPGGSTGTRPGRTAPPLTVGSPAPEDRFRLDSRARCR